MRMPLTNSYDRLRRPLVVWLAVLVVVLGALVVPMAHAFPRSDQIGSMEVCTSAGTQFIPADSADGQESAPLPAHCPFCLHQADACVPPPHLLP